MSVNTQVCTLPDGRQLSYCLAGAENGEPVFTFHGLPGSRMESLMFDATANQNNIRIITPDRPGYGKSTRHPIRSLSDWSADVAYLADSMEIQNFGVVGVSGGAPCALACAYYLPRRVTKAGILCGLGPLKHTGLAKHLHWYASLGFFLSRHLPIVLNLVYGLPVLLLAKASPGLVLDIIAFFNRGIDGQVLKKPGARNMLINNIQEAFRQGTAGAIADMRLYSRDWGFTLRNIQTHINIWHGDEDDIVPISHGQYIHEHLPNSSFYIMNGQGHFSLPINCAEPIFAHMAKI